MNSLIENNSFFVNIIILIFFIIIIHILLNEFFMKSSCSQKKSYKTQEDDQDQFENVETPTPIVGKDTPIDVKPTKKVSLFWASWCGHCVHFKPTFIEFKDKISNNKNIEVNMIQCDNPDNSTSKLLDKYQIQGFPTVIIEEYGKFKTYNGLRTVEGLMNALDNSNGPTPTEGNPTKPIPPEVIPTYNTVVNSYDNKVVNPEENTIVNSDDNKVVNSEENTVVALNFNTSWCGHSKNFQPIWDEFANSINYIPNMKAFDIKCDDNKNDELCKKFNIEGYPTVIIVRNNDIIPYDGPRNVKALQNTVLDIAQNTMPDIPNNITNL